MGMKSRWVWVLVGLGVLALLAVASSTERKW